jgi:N utilization substance protein B
MPIVDRLILRLGVSELLGGSDTPPPVVINEALELARTFSTEPAVKFINGVLDGINRELGTRS